MTSRASRVLDYALYIAIGLGIVLAAWASVTYDAGRRKWLYLALGTAGALGLILAAHARQRKHGRFWAVLLTLFAAETILLGIASRSRVFDKAAEDRGASRFLIYGIAAGESLLNEWVLRAFKPTKRS